MTQTLDAIFDGEVLRPETSLDLQPNTKVRLTVEVVEQKSENPKSFLETARSLKLQGSPDWSEKIDDYLYGESEEKQ